MSLPVLRTPRLVLRPWGRDDIRPLHQLWTLPEVRQYLWDDVVIPAEVAEQVVDSHLATCDSHSIGCWSLLPDEGGEIAGFCGFRFVENGPDIELLYGLRGDLWGKGLAVEASEAALEYLWNATSFDQVYARTDPPNERSVRVMERLGMSHESTSDTMITYVLRRPRTTTEK